MEDSHRLFNTRDLGGNYADMGRAKGGYAERIQNLLESLRPFSGPGA